ncbi:GL10745 [Drosophila persimilis]|uniref:GL10745 n=1 Tax=Drosophila persimilis TaxID=7234 RepID=B4GA97_DROPE|nr:GL10745 [Drosophila persimilis]
MVAECLLLGACLLLALSTRQIRAMTEELSPESQSQWQSQSQSQSPVVPIE